MKTFTLSVKCNLCSSSVNYAREALISMEGARQGETMFKGQRCNPKKGVEAHRGVAGKVGVNERRRQVEPSSHRATPIPFTPPLLSTLTILLAESYANSENTRLAFLSRMREDITHRYWLSANPY
ncbi:hypothetical protein ALC56_12070 [Trachymyrmex septentrionalis]|uniref:Uncharacterized protein n=2 Tax=Attini TaxID=143999 RepID=A0A195EZQ5_9HYME|nr:hypothetical protein G5I_00795 [Acromyrmex echinatior]KYN33359.1 hypothetical protein ALC56_12070 [Trachymyrmex septentrionalis]